MHLALLGDHPDGLHAARALAATGRHAISVLDRDAARAAGGAGFAGARVVTDLEEILANPTVEALIVATSVENRPALLRRALQAERHVLCLHPADTTPDIAYEAALIQGDTRRALVPLWVEGLHPALSRTAELCHNAAGGIGLLRLARWERDSKQSVLEDSAGAGGKHAFPGWALLQALGGKIAEVSAFAADTQITEDDPVLLSGRFDQGGLFQACLLPRQPEERCHVEVTGSQGRAELDLPCQWGQDARLRWQERSGESREETWDGWDPGPAVVALFEASVAACAAATSPETPLPMTWQDEVHGLELDDAARRSIKHRRAGTLEYQEASEEVGFKGTMTLVGCALVWVMLLLLILSRWLPALGWLIVPLIVGFLVLQMLGWIVPKSGAGKRPRLPPGRVP